MTEKLKVSREVADVLDSLNRKDLNTSTWLEMHSHKKWESAEKAPLNELSLEEFAIALIVGYEVEMTPHEVIAVETVDEACGVADSALHRTKEEMIDFALDTRNYELFMQLTSEQTDA